MLYFGPDTIKTTFSGNAIVLITLTFDWLTQFGDSAWRFWLVDLVYVNNTLVTKLKMEFSRKKCRQIDIWVKSSKSLPTEGLYSILVLVSNSSQILANPLYCSCLRVSTRFVFAREINIFPSLSMVMWTESITELKLIF